jgi:NAD(P)H-nitrite reductase large subunit
MTQHIIIGGGPAATNAIESIRQFEDRQSQITLISDEPAHSRMALPYWLAGHIPREQTHTADEAYFAKLGVDARIGSRVTKIDSAASSISLDDGSELSFDNLLIATGASPVAPPIPGADLPGVQPMWSLAHTELALQTTDGVDAPRAVLVGAGFVGFIVLNAMFKRGWGLSVVERESQVLPRMLDGASAGIVQSWLAEHNIGVHAGTTVTSINETDDGAKRVELENGTQLEADLVILATGIKANTELLDGAGIEIADGILVDDQMRTNVANIYAGGDVAQGPMLFGGDKEIHAIQPTAVDHGRVAGANMAGHEVHYPGSLLMNVVDVCGLQTASYGNWNDSSAEHFTIANDRDFIYRKLLWTGDQLTGAIFAGRSTDLGMLTDVGMIKGIMQTQTALGEWKEYLRENPFDVRRAYIGAGVAQKLVGTTLTGRPSQARGFHFGGAEAKAEVGDAHSVYVSTKS